MVDSTTSDAEQ